MKEGRARCPTAAEQAYTGQFTWSCTVALSWELAVSRWKLEVPGTPGVPVLPPVATGNKAALLQLLSIRSEMAVKLVTDWAVPMVGMQLNMARPEREELVVHSTESFERGPRIVGRNSRKGGALWQWMREVGIAEHRR